MLLQDQATALSNSVQDLQQQLKDLQLPDQIQQELVPIQDKVRKTTQDLNRSAVVHSRVLVCRLCLKHGLSLLCFWTASACLYINKKASSYTHTISRSAIHVP